MDIQTAAAIIWHVLTSTNVRRRWIIRALRRITGRIIDHGRIFELEQSTGLGAPVMTAWGPGGQRVVYPTELEWDVRDGIALLDGARITDGAARIAALAGLSDDQAAAFGRSWAQALSPSRDAPKLEEVIETALDPALHVRGWDREANPRITPCRCRECAINRNRLHDASGAC